MTSRDGYPTGNKPEAITGAGLLDGNSSHLLDGEVVVPRNIYEGGKKTGKTVPEGGWFVTGITEVEGEGLFVDVTKEDDAATKRLPLDSLIALNPTPIDEDTIPRNQKPAIIQKQIDQLEAGEGRELLIPAEAQGLGAPVVAEVVQVPEDEPKTPEEAPTPEIDIKEIFYSPDNLVNALQSGEIPPELKQQLREIVGAWKKIQLLDATDTLWRATVAPVLDTLRDAATARERSVRDMTDAIQNAQPMLVQLTDALYNRDNARAAEIMQHSGLRGRIDHLDEALHRPQPQDFQEAVLRLDFETEEAGEQLRRLSRSDAHDLTADEAAKIIDEYAESVRATGDITQLRGMLQRDAEDKAGAQPTWRHRKDIIEQVVAMGHRARRAQPQNLRHIYDELSEVRNMLQAGQRIDVDRLNTFSRVMLGKLQRDAEDTSRTLRVVRSYSEEAR